MADASPDLSTDPVPSALALATQPEPVPKGYWDLVWGQFLKNRVASFSVVIILLLLVIAAWAPVIANGKPFVWRQDGVTSYPLVQYLFAPTQGISVDYLFNFLLFATILVPLALVTGHVALRKYSQRVYRKRMGLCILIGFIVSIVPFFIGPKWRLDSTDYPRKVVELNASVGDYAVFPPIAHDPITPTRDYLKHPSSEHLLGTDKDGRDVMSRMLHGARISLSVGFVAELIVVVVGVIFGSLAGFYRGWVDIVIMRFIETVICFPSFFLILTIVAFIEPDKRSIFHIMLVMGITGWTGVARLIRGEFLKLSEQDFVQSARALGCTNSRLIFRHILPNAMGPVLVSAAFGVAGAILTESGLSFLGFGAPPPTPTWGEMISQGKVYLEEAWWLIVFPGFSIFVSVTIYNLAGDGLRDAMDPKMRK